MMTLYYEFEDIVCEKGFEESDEYQCRDGENTELATVNYLYNKSISFEDFFDYHKPCNFEQWNEEEKSAYERALRNVWNSDWLDIESLEENKDFEEFMTDKYRDEARSKCQEEME